MSPAVLDRVPGGGSGAAGGGDILGSWAERLGCRAGTRSRGLLRFASYGRVSTEDWQDPVTSRARQLQQAVMLTAGTGSSWPSSSTRERAGHCRGRGARRPPRW